MTTACPCFGRNENCRMCGGSGLVSSEVEVKVARAQQSTQNAYYSGQSDAQRVADADSQALKFIFKRRQESAMEAAKKQAKEVTAAEKLRDASALEAERRQRVAALAAMTPEGKMALKLKKEHEMKIAAERAARDAEQAANSIAFWNKQWGKGK